ncbi:MAG: AraC family transcriptional regulator [Clostridiales bacterium]|nr:AraC family transcriptional regulator [Clostridiales bacterium]
MDNIPTQIIYKYDNEHIQAIHSVGYYRHEYAAVNGNVRTDDLPLVVNCTGRVDLPYDFTTHERYGRHDYYLMYLTSGNLEALVDGKEYLLVPGDVVIFPPEREYRYNRQGNADIQYLWAHFTGNDAESMLRRFGFGAHGVFKIGIDENISMLFMLMMEDFVMQDKYYAESASNRLTSIFIAMRRKLDRIAELGSGSMGRIFESIKYIHTNFQKPISNEKLASIEHLSVSQYIELFKKSTGATPRSYIIELRIRNACDLLCRSDLTVSQIAQTVGYDDAHYFSRLFKLHRGISPENYRRSAVESNL